MKAPASGEAATHLPWLSPCAASLVALARSPCTAAWGAIRTDPGAVVLVARHTPATLPTAAPLLTPSLLQMPALLQDALLHLDTGCAGAVSWMSPERLPVYRASLAHARLAAALAERSGRCDPTCAWIAGLLAPVGWLALAAVDAAAAADCLSDAGLAADAEGVQRRHWGLDHASITRRLCRRWGLPQWLTAVVGHLDLGPAGAAALGAPIDLFRTVQLAAALAREAESPLALTVGGSPEDNREQLGLDPTDLEAVVRAIGNGDVSHVAAAETPEPALLRDLLRLALELRQLREDSSLVRLEGDVDNLHRALREQRRSEDDRLKAMKLASLAEFAAGASHEINNPLAVISGQAQYLLNHEPDPSRQRSLHTIIDQAHRIHEILTHLMQFARPPRPVMQSFDASLLTQRISSSLANLAEAKQVRLDVQPVTAAIPVRGDPEQLETALICLLRNALEAAPQGGWAGLRVAVTTHDRVEYVVEDNGSGPSPVQTEHLFDPFYSGRHAGRGRGLGLATAWRLARGQDGDVSYRGHQGGVTRFVLSLPRAPQPSVASGPPTSNGSAGPHPANGDAAPLNGQISVRLEP